MKTINESNDNSKIIAEMFKDEIEMALRKKSKGTFAQELINEIQREHDK